MTLTQKMVIDGEEVVVEIEARWAKSRPAEATKVGDHWAGYLAAERPLVKLRGRTVDGRDVSGTYRLIGRQDDVWVLSSDIIDAVG